jgi:hypothetical protein
VYTNGGNHFMLRNASAQLTISRGRIKSLLDVQLGYVTPARQSWPRAHCVRPYGQR